MEPGIYHDGWFGIRIEDDFLVNGDGHEFLSEDIPRDLDWFMIRPGDYDNASTDTNSEEGGNQSNVPAVGLFESLMLCSVVAVLTRPRVENQRKEEQK